MTVRKEFKKLLEAKGIKKEEAVTEGRKGISDKVKNASKLNSAWGDVTSLVNSIREDIDELDNFEGKLYDLIDKLKVAVAIGDTIDKKVASSLKGDIGRFNKKASAIMQNGIEFVTALEDLDIEVRDIEMDVESYESDVMDTDEDE